MLSIAKKTTRSLVLLAMAAGILVACSAPGGRHPMMTTASDPLPANTIISARTQQPITFDALIVDLLSVDVVYIGEQHTDPDHHRIQLKVLESLYAQKPDLKVGMEMFARGYQPVLERWSAGGLVEQDFLEKTHWYANWRYDFALYRDLLAFIQTESIALIGLNIASHIPPKIAVGGVGNLSAQDAALLPATIDTENADHRAYLEQVFKRHHIRGRENFEYFYSAQCVWEDTMAETVARHASVDGMLVITGNGHIYRKFGIPQRAQQRNARPYRTVYLSPSGTPFSHQDGDYIWITPARGSKRQPN